jgi:hypothetical protein
MGDASIVAFVRVGALFGSKQKQLHARSCRRGMKRDYFVAGGRKSRARAFE